MRTIRLTALFVAFIGATVLGAASQAWRPAEDTRYPVPLKAPTSTWTSTPSTWAMSLGTKWHLPDSMEYRKA